MIMCRLLYVVLFCGCIIVVYIAENTNAGNV